MPQTYLNRTGAMPWAVLLCKFQDVVDQPAAATTIANSFLAATPTRDGVFDYWWTVSYNRFSIAGSRVFGWFVVPIPQVNGPADRNARIEAAINQAQSNGIDFAPFEGIFVIFNEAAIQRRFVEVDGKKTTLDQPDSGAGSGKTFLFSTSSGLQIRKHLPTVFMGKDQWSVTFAAHEMGHGIQLDHSFSTAATTCGLGSDNRPGCYCDNQDIMSAMNVHMFNGNAGTAGPGISVPYLLKLGWIDRRRQSRLSPQGGSIAPLEVTLTALSEPNANDKLAFILETRTPSSQIVFFTIEYRQRVGFDRGLPRDGVIVHRWEPDDRSVVLHSDWRNQIMGENESYTDAPHNLIVSVLSLDTANRAARVRIGPARLALTMEGNLHVISTAPVSRGEYPYEGIKGYFDKVICEPRVFPYTENLQKQSGKFRARHYFFRGNVTVEWFINSVRLSMGTVSTISFTPLQARRVVPPLGGSYVAPFEVTLKYETNIAANTVELWNDDSSINYSFTLTAVATDQSGNRLDQSTNVEVTGNSLVFDTDFWGYFWGCVGGYIKDMVKFLTHRLTIPKDIRPPPIEYSHYLETLLISRHFNDPHFDALFGLGIAEYGDKVRDALVRSSLSALAPWNENQNEDLAVPMTNVRDLE